MKIINIGILAHVDAGKNNIDGKPAVHQWSDCGTRKRG